MLVLVLEPEVESLRPRGGLNRVAQNGNVVVRFLGNRVVRLLARVSIGGLFLVTGVDKILHPYSFMAAIESYGVISGNAVLVVGVLFPWLEGVFGATLLLGVFPRTSAAVISGLLCVFTAAMFLAWGKELSSGCGCFPWEEESVTVGWSLVSRDIGVLLVSLYSWLFPSRWLALYPADAGEKPASPAPY